MRQTELQQTCLTVPLHMVYGRVWLRRIELAEALYGIACEWGQHIATTRGVDMELPTRVVQYGIGAIGSALTALLTERKWVNVVGAVDVDEAKVGKDLGLVAGIGRSLGVPVSRSLQEALAEKEADIVVHSTGSRLRLVWPQIREAAEEGLDIVSSCEELAYPWHRQPELAQEIDEYAKSRGVSVLGTGVNPGFVMDTLVLALTAACQRVETIRVHRVLDAATRRLPLQRKIGAGMTVEEFQEKVSQGMLGHVGLEESLMTVADALGWNLDDLTSSTEPVVAQKRTQSAFITVEPGLVLGLRQVASGLSGGREAISLKLEMYLGAPNPRDSIKVTGVPSLDVIVDGGTPGDPATVAILVNVLPRVIAARPGLLTMKDLTLPFAVFQNP